MPSSGSPSPRVDAAARGFNDARWLTPAVAVLVVCAIAFPRSATSVFLVPVVAGFAVLATQYRGADVRLSPNGLLLALLAFAAWSLMSAIWSVAPMASMSKPLFLIGGTLGAAVLMALGRKQSDWTLEATARGILLGAAIGGTLVCIETLTDQAIARFVMNLVPSFGAGQTKHVTIADGVVTFISDANINRRTTIVTLLIVPAALLLYLRPQGSARLSGFGLLAAIALTLIAFSAHQSSQAAILLAAVAFGLALLSPLWTRRAIAAAWCVCCLLIVPLVIGLHEAGLQNSQNGLFASARHRVVIWNTTAQLVRYAPLRGIGADATATKTEADELNPNQSAAKTASDGGFRTTTARHAHNVFLQVWYELGAIGALLFAAVGLAAMTLVARAPTAVQPYLLAQFAAVSGMLAFSFSVWQLWFQGAIGLGALAILVALLSTLQSAEHPGSD